MSDVAPPSFRWGVALALASSAAFGTAGPFAKSLLVAGWSPFAVVTLRVAGAALLLSPVVLRMMSRRWAMLRHEWPLVAAYGLIAVALAQLSYFHAVQTLSVGMALLLEYSGILLVVLYLWVFRGVVPSRVTGFGVVVSVAGLMLVLDVFTGLTVDRTGMAWGLLAGVGLAAYYLISAQQHEEALPPIALAGLGLSVGAAGLILAGVLRLASFTVASRDTVIAGAALPWWVAVAELAVVAAALAYVTGIAAVRIIGATVASFVGLAEVLFAVLFAWLLLGEVPTVVQAVGGLLVIGGVVAVRLGERQLPVVAGDPDPLPVLEAEAPSKREPA
ncbi:MAG: EamA family transporter [Nostocoides sp.]